MSNFKDLVRLGKDATTRYTQGGKAVTVFSAAFDVGYGDKKQTVWLDVSGWGDRYEKVAQYLTKGSQVVVEGDIGTREYEGKTYITLNLTDLKLVSGQRDGNRPAQRQERSAPTRQADPLSDFSDDNPF